MDRTFTEIFEEIEVIERILKTNIKVTKEYQKKELVKNLTKIFEYGGDNYKYLNREERKKEVREYILKSYRYLIRKNQLTIEECDYDNLTWILKLEYLGSKYVNKKLKLFKRRNQEKKTKE